MLKIKDLSYSYGSIQTLNSVDMEMETGKVTCILGRNGVGKTTSIAKLTNLYQERTRRCCWAPRIRSGPPPSTSSRNGGGAWAQT